MGGGGGCTQATGSSSSRIYRQQTSDLRLMSQIQRFIKNNWERVKQKILLFIAERRLGSGMGCLINAVSPKSDQHQFSPISIREYK